MSLPYRAEWRYMTNGSQQYHEPGFAVFGVIRKFEDDMWEYKARIMTKYRIDIKEPQIGLASSAHAARLIVEAICQGTGTCVTKKQLESR